MKEKIRAFKLFMKDQLPQPTTLSTYFIKATLHHCNIEAYQCPRYKNSNQAHGHPQVTHVGAPHDVYKGDSYKLNGVYYQLTIWITRVVSL